MRIIWACIRGYVMLLVLRLCLVAAVGWVAMDYAGRTFEGVSDALHTVSTSLRVR